MGCCLNMMRCRWFQWVQVYQNQVSLRNNLFLGFFFSHMKKGKVFVKIILFHTHACNRYNQSNVKQAMLSMQNILLKMETSFYSQEGCLTNKYSK